MIAAVGNSVFHPVDYTILSVSVSPRRLGRAFSVHTLCGNLGWAAAPVSMVTLASLFGWRLAIISAVFVGIVVLLFLAVEPAGPERGPKRRRKLGHPTGTRHGALGECPGAVLLPLFRAVGGGPDRGTELPAADPCGSPRDFAGAGRHRAHRIPAGRFERRFSAAASSPTAIHATASLSPAGYWARPSPSFWSAKSTFPPQR